MKLTMSRWNGPARPLLALLALTLGLPRLAGATPLSFEVSFTSQVRSTPFTGRILVFTGTAQDGTLRSWVDDFGWPRTFYALEVQELAPDQTVRIDENTLGFPAPPTEWPRGLVRFQAVLDQAPDDWRIGTAPGNGYSLVVEAQPSDAPVRLVIDQLVPERTFTETNQVRLVDIPSPRLTAFYGRPMRLRAGVVLPDDYLEQPNKRFPVVYVIFGYGSDDHFPALALRSWWPNLVAKSGLDALVVVLNPTTHWGHTAFTDSANNGPAGTALVEEMVPEIDRTFRTIADPKARLLMGHSFGAYGALRLQTTYPDLFGGVWSLAPVFVDFRSFVGGTDLYAPGANLFTDSQGKPRPVYRGTEIYVKLVSDLETVLGHGGPAGWLPSFEAVCSPRGADGRPQLLWDRRTGAIDSAVVAAWRPYDISQTLTRDWAVLGPKLAGKLHVYVGDQDDLAPTVGLLKQSQAALGSDATIEIVPGKDHMGILLDPSLTARYTAEMTDTLRRAGMIGSSGVP